MKMQTRVISSLEKVFADEPLAASPYTKGSVLQGEKFSFQWACCPEEGDRAIVKMEIQADFEGHIRTYKVGHVPSLLAAYSHSDDNHLRKTPGLYPDVLEPYTGSINLMGGQWRSLWVEMEIDETIKPGKHLIRLTMTDLTGEEILASDTFELEVIGVSLPDQTLIHTEWFHVDCLASYYQVPVFSEQHWQIIDRFMASAVRYGINMLLTPVFTPPLDTEIGGERPTVQLVDVTVKDGRYTFGFEKLQRYMDMAAQNGIRYFEISHLFTQWGAKCAPKIVGLVDGVEKKLFGWETEATDPAYTTFLRQFLTELKAFLRKTNRLNSCYFHISDEPSVEMLESYRAARDSVADILADCHMIDALSDYAFYESGLVPHPVPSNDHIESFLKNNVPDLWTYYCCGQVVDVSNRMMAMPSARCRILGWQLYKYNIVGFLQWGFNFWYTHLSKKAIDPYRVTDADEAFPSGDAFMVYPGEDGMPVSSIRQIVFNESLQDMRALQLLGAQMGQEALVTWIDSLCEKPITFKQYPHHSEWILEMREAVNRKIASLMG